MGSLPSDASPAIAIPNENAGLIDRDVSHLAAHTVTQKTSKRGAIEKATSVNAMSTLIFPPHEGTLVRLDPWRYDLILDRLYRITEGTTILHQ